MMDLILLGTAAVFFLLTVSRICERSNLLFAALGDDEDVRVAGSGVKPRFEAEDSSASDYVSHRTTGNIETAMQLGGRLAKMFCERYRKLAEQLSAEISEQMIILDSYAVNRVVQNLPNSLIAQTVLSTFYSAVGQESSELYQAVRDPVPFSLYILRDRKNFQTESYGEVFASLCGDSGNAALAAQADAEYQNFFDQCEEIANGFAFQKV